MPEKKSKLTGKFQVFVPTGDVGEHKIFDSRESSGDKYYDSNLYKLESFADAAAADEALAGDERWDVAYKIYSESLDGGNHSDASGGA